MRLFCWSWQEAKTAILTFAGPSMMKVSDVFPQSTFSVTQGQPVHLEAVRFYKGHVKIRPEDSQGDIPATMCKRPEELQSLREVGHVEYVNLVGRFYKVTEVRNKSLGERTSRYRSICLQTFTASVQGLEKFAWVDVDERVVKYYSKLDLLTPGAPVLVSEVKSKTYRTADAIKQSLNMTQHSQVVPTRAPEDADNLAVQSEEILEAFKDAFESPLRRKSLKRLLSDAENPSTPSCDVRRRLDSLKIKGACAGQDQADDPPEVDHHDAEEHNSE